MELERHSNTSNKDSDGRDDYDNKKGNEVEENEKGNGNRVEEPKLNMVFDSTSEIYEYYRKYAAQIGFGVSKRSTKKIAGVVKYFTIVCHSNGESKKMSKISLKSHSVIKVGCKAKLCAKLLEDGKWGVTTLELNHNHVLSPSKSLFYRCNRHMTTHVKRRPELKNDDGISMKKCYNSLRIEYGENELPCISESNVGNLKRLRLAEGDVSALQSYLIKVQAINSNFFYVLDLDEDNRIRNLFWADSRFRAAYEEFGDIITFDTTYLTNNYDLPFALFLGVNHHGQYILLGCGLISDEDTRTFAWLFDVWLSSMSRIAPHAIITNKNKEVLNAVETVFPNARHRWCLWHIMEKVPEKLKGYGQYESIRFLLHNVVYDSSNIDEFESGWKEMIEKYDLESNEWMEELYNERYRWVPCFLKDCFWAGMSTTQRGESMNAFFDGFVTAKTSLKEFVNRYDIALKSKVEKEIDADAHSLTSLVPCITPHAMEKQIQNVYTNSKFQEFQREVANGMFCECRFLESQGRIFLYEVKELCYFGENQEIPKLVNFKVCFIEEEGESEFDVKCNCRLFEFRGILCKHIVKVLLFERFKFTLPAKYILRRWRKDIKRRHTKTKVTYSNWKDTEQGKRYDKMCDVFHDVADMSYDSRERFDQLVDHLLDLKMKWNSSDGVCASTQPSQKSNFCGSKKGGSYGS